MRVDVHSHYTPPSFLQMLRQVGAFDDLSVLRLFGHMWRTAPTTEEPEPDLKALAARLADMDAASVNLQIISIGALQPYVSDPQTAAALARHANNAYRALLDEAPTRLGAFGCLPLPHADESVAEIGRCLDDLGLAGIALGCSAAGLTLDDEQLAPVWTALDSRNAVVYLHPGVEIGGIVGCSEFHLAPDLVSPSELAVAACRLIVTGHLDRYANVTLILATLGGAIPFLARRFDRGFGDASRERYEEMGGVLRQFRRYYCDTSVTEEPAALAAARDTFGADRLLLGSDYPRPGSLSSVAVEYVQGSEYLSESEKSAILDRNAVPLLPGA